MTSALKTAIQTIKKHAHQLTTTSPILSISFHPESRLKLIPIPSTSDDDDPELDRGQEFIPVYSNGSDITGTLDVLLSPDSAPFDYEEIAVYLVGHVIASQVDHDQVFLSHKVTLEPKPGTLTRNASFDFKFPNPRLTLDSYYGTMFQCRYFIRAILNRSKILQSNVKNDHDFAVMNIQRLRPKKPVTMQVGVDDCLHIKFEYDNINIAVDGALEGRVIVLSNTLKITSMQIQLIRREMVRTAEHHRPEVLNTVILGKYEIMDGLPGDGEEIPIRMFMQRFKHVTNTQISAHHSVRYYVNLGLIDKDGRRYFKTCEITLFRTKPM